jgi:hypothetical protein
VIDGVPVGAFLGSLGPWAVTVALGLWVLRLVLTGKLVTRQQLLDKIEECNLWRSTAERWQASAHEQGMAVVKLTASVDATNYALSQIQGELIRESPQ